MKKRKKVEKRKAEKKGSKKDKRGWVKIIVILAIIVLAVSVIIFLFNLNNENQLWKCTIAKSSMKQYLYQDTKYCQQADITCPEGQRKFHDACGCGCEAIK